MANSRIYLKSEAGGTTTLSRDTTANSGNLVLPASGNVASVDTAVTDNAIARYDGTTGKLQNSGVIINDNGNVGIGTGSPIDKLTMYSASGNLFSRTQSGTSTLLTGVYSDGTTCVNSLGNYPLILLTNNNERMRIDSSGNVGIGKTPVYKLDVNGNIGYGVNGVGYIISDTNWGCLIKADSAGAVAQFAILDNAGNKLIAVDNNGYFLQYKSTGIGYGAGAGGTVTQLTSKSTAVTLNKPCGAITMNNAALAAGASVEFILNNTVFNTLADSLYVITGSYGYNYTVEAKQYNTAQFLIRVKNISAGSLSEPLEIKFVLIKGATA